MAHVCNAERALWIMWRWRKRFMPFSCPSTPFPSKRCFTATIADLPPRLKIIEVCEMIQVPFKKQGRCSPNQVRAGNAALPSTRDGAFVQVADDKSTPEFQLTVNA